MHAMALYVVSQGIFIPNGTCMQYNVKLKN